MRLTATPTAAALRTGQEQANARALVDRLQAEVSKLPQYEPKTSHYFHGGMYCREVYRDGGVLVVGKVHLKEHFYVIASGTVQITDGSGPAQEFTGPKVIESLPGTKRAVYSVTPTTCLTFHRTDANNPEDAETELVESDPTSTYLAGNLLKQEVLT
jgi:hypothetical protein